MSVGRNFATVIRNRNAALILVASVISTFGDWFYLIAISALLYDQGGVVAVAAFNILRQVPVIFLTPLAGIVADRLPRRALMIATDLIRMVVMLALGVLSASPGGSASLALALVVTSVLSGSLFRPARMSLLPTMVQSDELMALNALDGTVGTATLAVAPAIGGLFLVMASREWLFYLNSVSFLFSAALVWLVKPTSAAPAGEQVTAIKGKPYSGWGQGFHHTVANKRLFLTTLLYSCSHVIVGATWVVLPPLAVGVLHLGEAGIGYLSSAIGIGSVVGMLAGGLISRRDKAMTATTAVLLFGLVTVVCARSAGIVSVLAAITLMGLFANVAEAPIWTLFQQETPQKLYGRVFSVIDAIAMVGLFVGSMVAGLVTERAGSSWALSVLGTAVALSALAIMVFLRRRANPARGLEQTDITPM